LKFFCSWLPCKEASIEVNVIFPRTGFVCGETAAFTIEINNGSTRRVNRINAELYQKVSYYAKSFKREDNSVLAKEKINLKVEPGESKIWKQNAMRIPPCPPTRLACARCRIIHMDYITSR